MTTTDADRTAAIAQAQREDALVAERTAAEEKLRRADRRLLRFVAETARELDYAKGRLTAATDGPDFVADAAARVARSAAAADAAARAARFSGALERNAEHAEAILAGSDDDL